MELHIRHIFEYDNLAGFIEQEKLQHRTRFEKADELSQYEMEIII